VELTVPPDHLAGFQGPTSKRKGGEGEDIEEERTEKERKVMGRKGRESREPTFKGRGGKG